MTKEYTDFETWLSSKTVAICIPCLNEETTIEQVINDFRKAIPQARIRVYDNNSTDNTSGVAQAAGADVRKVHLRGKGYVIRSIFNESDEDFVIMADGDATYSADSVLELLENQYKMPGPMIVGTRRKVFAKKAFRPLHILGNRLISWLIALSFNYPLTDVLSGYRVFPKSLYKSLGLNSQSFEVETEMTLQVVALKVPVVEVSTPYYARPSGSYSKLNTWRDGFLILKTIALLVRYYRPLFFFNLMSAIFAISGLVIGWVPISDYLEYKYVYHIPLSLLAASLIIISIIFFSIGLVLDSIRYYHQIQMKKLNRDLGRD